MLFFVNRLNLKIGQERPLQDYHCGDAVLQQVLQDCKEVFKYHEHETLLLDNPAEHLNENERQKAWKEYTEQNESKLCLIVICLIFNLVSVNRRTS